MNLFLNVVLLSAQLIWLAKSEEISTSNYFSTNQDKIYRGGDRLARIHGTDQISCALYCSRRDDCYGANFDISKGECSLVSLGSSKKLKEAAGIIFMEVVSNSRCYIAGD